MSGSEKNTILLVDDVPENLAVLSGILKQDYRILAAKNGQRCLELAQRSPKPDLILLDVIMPEMNGYHAIKKLKTNKSTKDIPVIFVTAKGDTDDETKGLTLGAVDYLVKPVNAAIVLARVRTHLENKLAKDILTREKGVLESMVEERTRELSVTQRVTMRGFTTLAEARDNETGIHILRTEKYLECLAVYLLKNNILMESKDHVINVDLLIRSAPLHDIGKVGIPDSILLKPGKLDPEEFEIMKTHTTLGYQALAKAEKDEGTSACLLYAKEICLNHHEKWDGSGYPQGLAGKDISLSGRLMALADVYDALISKRVYKDPIPHSKAREIILSESGRHFDPQVAQAFDILHEQFRQIGLKYVESNAEREALES